MCVLSSRPSGWRLPRLLHVLRLSLQSTELQLSLDHFTSSVSPALRFADQLYSFSICFLQSIFNLTI